MMSCILLLRKNALSLQSCKFYKQKVGIVLDTDFVIF